MQRFVINIILIILIALSLNAQIGDDWPDTVNSVINSSCVVEFYQPQRDNLDIKDQARIKRNLTGLLVRGDGLIVTTEDIYSANLDISSGGSFFHQSQHLPEDISVIFDENRKFEATFIGKDEETKLAFVKINNPENLPDFVTFDSSSVFQIGEPVFLIERLDKSYDFQPIVTCERINSVIQKPRQQLLVNSSLKSLSDGGLVTDKNGNAIGLIHSNQRNYYYDPESITSQQTLLEILPAKNFVKFIAKPPTMTEIKQGLGKSWLGIQMQMLKKEMAEYWDLGDATGIIINSLVANSPAENAGLKIGDIITSVNGFKITGDDNENLTVFRNFVRNLPEGPVTTEYIRNGKRHTTQIVLKSAPKSQFLAEELPVKELGLSVKELTQDIFLTYNIDFETEGVWVSRVEAAGIANIAGLSVGDLILKVNDYSVKDLDSFKKYTFEVIEKKPKYIQLFVLRHNKTLFLYLKNRINE